MSSTVIPAYLWEIGAGSSRSYKSLTVSTHNLHILNNLYSTYNTYYAENAK